ncbi:glycosyltransferase [Modestobacter sp. VKM Ac-2983]|uniref:glycosyltransferase n=1 Tax=Modestobacter sp. VKM Ac-2983 TaxID=3004137 RepID=UPI0022AB6B23|nr:glycosyltransferase [Modestobacter sp. VKM Ac-2983]MCZ2806167.1 glycosyltransferase [Modestobacter sp. VKM Ac-2983]
MTPNPWLITGIFAAILAVGVAWFEWRGSPGWTIYGGAVAVILGSKLLLSLLPARRWGPAPDLRVAVVVPFYNEDPAILARALDSIDSQTHTPTAVYIIDDGSTLDDARTMAHKWAESRPHATVIYQANAGKREAMGQAFRALAGFVDIFVCVDSDTVLEPAAIRRGLAPFSDPRTAAVTGTVVALNQDKGLLPRLLDLRYVNAFLYERAAYSRLGSVLCVCGSLAFWRAEIVAKHLDEFLGQTFLGAPAVAGDDRHLTNLSLLHGRVVLAHGAVARTAVPEKSGHLIRQQIRWGKSFFRESWWALTHLSPKRVAWWLTAVESVSWAGFTIGLLMTAFILPMVTGQFLLVDYLGWIVLAGYGRSVHVFSVRRPDWSRWEQAGAFLLAPVYGMLHVMVLLPLRIYSLATLRQTAWGTRAAVEVSDAEPNVVTVLPSESLALEPAVAVAH